jgi:hypothetical protein
MRGSMSAVILPALVLLALPMAQEAPSVGVLPPVTGDVVPSTAAGEAAEDAVSKHGALELVRTRTVAELVTRAKRAGVSCKEPTPECLARVGAYAQLDFLLLVRATAGDPARMRVDLVDCLEARALRSVESTLTASAAERLAAVRSLSRAALTGEPPTGLLRVDVSRGIARVFVDGDDRGVTPLELELEVGPHELRVQTASGATAEAQPEVSAGAATTLSLTPALPATGPAAAGEESGARGGPGAMLYVGAGLLGAGLIGAVGSGVGAALIAPDVDNRGAVTAQQYNDAVLLGRILLGVGAGFGALGVVGAGVAVIGVTGGGE